MQDILIPTDGSDQMASVSSQGLELARTFDATIHALSIIDQTHPVSDWEEFAEMQEKRANDAVRRISTRANVTGLSVEESVRSGIPHEEILAYVEANDIDLVVMNTYSWTDTDRTVVGEAGDEPLEIPSFTDPTPEQVVDDSPVPVLTIWPPGADPQ